MSDNAAGPAGNAVIDLPVPQTTFRRRELERLLAILGERRPVVILLTGDPDMGKTSLLADLRAGAAARGWSTAGGDPERRLVVHPHTREPDLREAVLAAAEATGKPPRHANDRAKPARAFPQGAGGLEPFVAELSQRAPLLVLIDDYRPSPSFAEWFERVFLPAVPRSGVPLIFAIAERPGTRPLEAVATETVDLGPLDAEVVRCAFEAMLPPLEPPMSNSELEHYIGAAKSPAVLASLIRVLSLAGRREAV